MGETINSISPDLRDELLKRNLILADSITNNGLIAKGEGLGIQIELDYTDTNVKESPDIQTIGELYLDKLIIQNPYQPQSSEPISLTEPTPIGNKTPTGPNYPTSGLDSDESPLFLDNNNTLGFNIGKNIYFDKEQQTPLIIQDTTSNPKLGSYTDINGNLNFGGVSTQPGDIIGSVLRGGSLGLNQNGGLITNFDLRTSLAGRLLNSSGVINDTPMGQIGAQQLAFGMLTNIANNTQKNTVGRLNLDPISLLRGGDLIVKDYSITVPSGVLGSVVDMTQRILGIEIPRSELQSSGSIFASESDSISNTLRAQAMIENTGRGQVVSLFDNLKYNKSSLIKQSSSDEGTPINRYAPSYKDSRKKSDGINGNLYAGDDGNGHFIDVLSGPENVPISNSQPRLSSEFNGLDGKFVWSNKGQQQTNKDDIGFETTIFPDFNKGILKKTQELFATGKMKTMVSALSGSAEVSETQSAVYKGSVSRGCLARDENNQFCRTFSHFKGYNRVDRLKRHSGLLQNAGLRSNIDKSVLEDTGFVKIAPYNDNVKKFMFSIENLAWADLLGNLPEVEIGPGDKTTGTKGRIMWFPPYDLQFTDNHTASWESTNFIGRGEPIYTYSNSERSGTLQFKVITDFSNALQQIIDESLNEDEIMSFIHGCRDLPSSIGKNLSKNELDARDVKLAVNRLKTISNKTTKTQFTVYFANNTSKLIMDYESTGVNRLTSESYTMDTTVDGEIQGSFTNDFGLNKDFLTQITGGKSSPLATYLTDICPECKIEVRGYASKQGTGNANQTLSKNRAETIKAYMIDNLGLDSSRFTVTEGKGETGTATQSSDQDSETVKKDRKVDVIMSYDANSDPDVNSGPEITPSQFNDLTDLVKSKFFREDFYFNKIAQESPTVYNSLKEKIQFFHPAFHSTTPEGFNSRLNFLAQCTRQGPTGDGEKNPTNLAFGKPPVCILRIGDFYHTKIVIDNINFSFEQLWDLNPEGIGVQPMIATVDMSFKFIGGSSLDGPINKLQNAVSFNYFANTEVYDTRADSIVDNAIKDGFFPGKLPKNPTKVGVSENKNPESDQLKNVDIEATKTATQIPDSYSDKKKAMVLIINTVNRDTVTFTLRTPEGGLGKETTLNFTISKTSNILGHTERDKTVLGATTDFVQITMNIDKFTSGDTLMLKMEVAGAKNNIKKNFTVPNA